MDCNTKCAGDDNSSHRRRHSQQQWCLNEGQPEALLKSSAWAGWKSEMKSEVSESFVTVMALIEIRKRMKMLKSKDGDTVRDLVFVSYELHLPLADDWKDHVVAVFSAFAASVDFERIGGIKRHAHQPRTIAWPSGFEKAELKTSDRIDGPRNRIEGNAHGGYNLKRPSTSFPSRLTLEEICLILLTKSSFWKYSKTMRFQSACGSPFLSSSLLYHLH